MAQEYCTIDLRKVYAYSWLVARPSPVSDQVKGLLSTGDRHLWSIDELHEAVVKELGAADYSTVFRAVSTFERDGLIDRIDLGDGKVHYELADEHHEHIRCDSCGRVVEVPGCVLEGASAAVTGSTGFKVTSHQLLFGGVCPECDSARQG
jgi:Fe2+ or Zn2+ uptake regulation protein